MTREVDEHIIRPMGATFLPPKHLRHDHELREEALGQYRRALAPFDEETLALAWEHVRGEHTYHIWPTPAEFVAAARLLSAKSDGPSEEERKRERARVAAEAYVARYRKTSAVFARAAEEGWSGPLADYVAACAWAQAQLIAGVRDVGFDSMVLAGVGPAGSAREGFAAYRDTVRSQIESGKIAVRIPKALALAWKEATERSETSPRPDPAWDELLGPLRGGGPKPKPG